jgi:hypothetical protein
MVKDAKYFFLYLLAICASSENCLQFFNLLIGLFVIGIGFSAISTFWILPLYLLDM